MQKENQSKPKRTTYVAPINAQKDQVRLSPHNNGGNNRAGRSAVHLPDQLSANESAIAELWLPPCTLGPGMANMRGKILELTSVK